MAKKKKDNLKLPRKHLLHGDILDPVDISKLGTGNDPCFGKAYDLSTDECKICGDSELCCIKFAQVVGKTRKELEEANNYKDLETLVDTEGCRKYYRKLKREGLSKKDILDKIQAKYELSREEVRALYRKFNNK